MKARILAVVQELQRLKREGVTSVAVSEDALAGLRAAIERRRASYRSMEKTTAPSARAAPSAGPTRSEAEPAHAPASPPSSAAGSFADSSGRKAAAGFSAVLESASLAAPSISMRDSIKSPKAPPAAASTLPPPPVISLPAGTKRERWEWLRDRVLNCDTCLARTPAGLKVVFGVGDVDSQIFFCGEAPGADEEIQGEPFVGAAGRLLTKMIIGMGLQREQVYISNILNWRPQMDARRSGTSMQQTGNRPPTDQEMRFGLTYLRAQVEVVQPKVIVALGSTAAAGLLGPGSFKSLGSIRGQWHEFNGTPLMVTYHPSYLLRNASNKTKRVVWEDLLLVMEKVGLPISAKQRGYFL